MRILFLGDIVGQAARKYVIRTLPDLRRRYRLDFVIVNADNLAHGFGQTRKTCEAMLNAGADVLTCGNHVWDNDEMHGVLEDNPAVLRPANFPQTRPGKGCGFYTLEDGRTIAVMHVQGQLFLGDEVDNPFKAAAGWAETVKLGRDANAMVIDFHAEATSEKMAFGQFCDGKVSFVVGSHTHIPTADAQILPNGTAYQTDAGMCGCYDSVIGMDKKEPVSRFATGINGGRLEPADTDPTVCGAVVETDDKTGLARKIVMIRYGGRLQESLPVL